MVTWFAVVMAVIGVTAFAAVVTAVGAALVKRANATAVSKIHVLPQPPPPGGDTTTKQLAMV